MKKNKIRHFETLKRDMFPPSLPKAKNGGETKKDGKIKEPRIDYGIEPQQPTHDEIWEWFRNPDKY